MSLSHTSAPTVQIPNPRFDSTAQLARYDPTPAHSSDRPMVRLPSYKELTAASQCDDAFPRAGRSSLFTSGLLHLPPLTVPNRPMASGSKSRYDSPRLPPHEESEDEFPHTQTRYLDLSIHCPNDTKPPRRTTSPYNDSLHSVESTDLDSLPDEYSSSHRGLTLPRPTSGTQLPRPLGGHALHRHPGPHTAWPPMPLSLRDFGAPPSYEYESPQPKLKFSHAKAGGRTKKQALSCFFCRERKIACGRPDEGSTDQSCNQCSRRKIECKYPTVSHRGQHSRIKSAARKATLGYEAASS